LKLTKENYKLVDYKFVALFPFACCGEDQECKVTDAETPVREVRPQADLLKHVEPHVQSTKVLESFAEMGMRLPRSQKMLQNEK
jgi:hypothetical protein